MIGPLVSEEFDHAAESFRHSHYADEGVILAALRIAANVMRPGFIEEELMHSFGGQHDLEAENLRRTLTLKGAAAG